MTDSPPSSDPTLSNRQSWSSSFAVAWSGLWYTLRTQRSMGAHVLATACVIALAWWLAVSTVEWCILAIVIGLVGTAELLNTAIEVVVNELCPDRNRYAGLAKDISAGGVLWASMSAVVVGLVIFGPKLWVLIFNQT